MRAVLWSCWPLAAGAAACDPDPAIMENGQAGGGRAAPGAAAGGDGQGGGGPRIAIAWPDAGAAGAGSAVSPENNCGIERHRLERVPPELLLVLDRSTSMNAAVPGSASNRWVETSAAILDVLGQTEAAVHWGLKTFPEPSGCTVSAGVEVPIGPSSRPVADAVGRMGPASTGEGTPTAEAVRGAAAYLKARSSRSPRYVVLATDGQPSCPRGGGSNEVQALALGAINEARAAGLDTFVIGIATAGTEADGILGRMAAAGGRPRPGSPAYYPVASRKELVEALGAIARVVATCTYPLGSTPPSPDDVAVNLDGMRIPRDPGGTNGWQYAPGNTAINLFGPACERLEAGEVKSVEIIFGCPNVPIP